jgi:hypothetical protein
MLGVGNGLIVTASVREAEHEPSDTGVVSVTLTEPVPAAPQTTLRMFVLAAPLIVPPVTDHAYELPTTLGVTYDAEP